MIKEGEVREFKSLALLRSYRWRLDSKGRKRLLVRGINLSSLLSKRRFLWCKAAISMFII